MKEIIVKGFQRPAIVDDDEYEMLCVYKWHKAGKGYVQTYTRMPWSEGKLVSVKMHRMILGLKRGDGNVVDHINGDPLDNRRSNLRICTYEHNAWNSKKKSTNKSGFKGVSFRKETRKYEAHICVKGKNLYLGSFYTA